MATQSRVALSAAPWESGDLGASSAPLARSLRRDHTMPVQYRQGDLLFVQQESRPVGGLVARTSLVIVAGEATGHAHRLTAGTILEGPDGTLYLDLAAPTRVVHEVHEAL